MATIYQSSEVSDKADIAIENPFPPFVDFDTGDPLGGGFLYFGLVGRDGEVAANRKKVYALMENGAAVQVSQPVRLSSGGVPQYNGNPVQFAVDGSYSLKVKDSADVLQYFAPKVTAKTLLGYSGIIPEESVTYDGINGDLVFTSIEATTGSFYASTDTGGTVFNGQYMRKDVDYEALNETTIRLLTTYPANTVILGRALDPTGQTVQTTSGSEILYIFDTRADAIDKNLKIGDSVLINGGDNLGDGKGGSYLVVAGGTGTDDNFSFIDLDNGNQLKIKSLFQVFQGYSEAFGEVSSSSGEVTIDLADGLVRSLTLTENVSQITLTNIPESGSVKLELKIIQSAAGSNTVGWTINGVAAKASGGVLPTVTVTADAVDRYLILTEDGGTSFEVYTAGQDIK